MDRYNSSKVFVETVSKVLYSHFNTHIPSIQYQCNDRVRTIYPTKNLAILLLHLKILANPSTNPTCFFFCWVSVCQPNRPFRFLVWFEFDVLVLHCIWQTSLNGWTGWLNGHTHSTTVLQQLLTNLLFDSRTFNNCNYFLLSSIQSMTMVYQKGILFSKTEIIYLLQIILKWFNQVVIQ